MEWYIACWIVMLYSFFVVKEVDYNPYREKEPQIITDTIIIDSIVNDTISYGDF